MGEKSAAIMDELVKMRTSVATPTGGPTAATAAGAATGAGSPKYECELCLESFNLYDRKPFSLVPCGHSLCIKCFDSLTKTTCPYCRAVFTSKIPNWEIVKRLPKPILPIIFYQVEKKIVALEKVSDEYNKLIVEVNQEYRKKLSEIGDESNRKSNSDRIKRIEKRLDEINANNQELENNLRRKMDKIKSQIDTDEVKFNEENLKKTKSDMDKMSSSMTERIKMVKKDREELMNILTSNTNSTPTEILTRVENELRDNSAYKQVYRELNSIFAAANVVRPISNASDSPSMADSNVDGEEQLVCRPSQKIVIIVIIAILTFIFMLYPLAMIIIGSMNLSECPMNYLIPVWLVVGGSGGIVAEIFIAGLVIYTFFRAFHHRTLTEKLLQIFLFIIPFILVLVFNLAWFFTGNAWVYPSYKFVQFTESTNATTYCNQTVFLFAFWSLNFAYILFGIFLIALNMVCCCICFLKR